MEIIDKILLTEFDKQVFRLNKWKYTPVQIKAKESDIQFWRKKFLYDYLEKEEENYKRLFVLSMGKKKRKLPVTGNHIKDTIQLMTFSKDASEFERFFKSKNDKDDFSHIEEPKDKPDNPITFDEFLGKTFKKPK